jgi:hypothetical protein
MGIAAVMPSKSSMMRPRREGIRLEGTSVAVMTRFRRVVGCDAWAAVGGVVGLDRPGFRPAGFGTPRGGPILAEQRSVAREQKSTEYCTGHDGDREAQVDTAGGVDERSDDDRR